MTARGFEFITRNREVVTRRYEVRRRDGTDVTEREARRVLKAWNDPSQTYDDVQALVDFYDVYMEMTEMMDGTKEKIVSVEPTS